MSGCDALVATCVVSGVAIEDVTFIFNGEILFNDTFTNITFVELVQDNITFVEATLQICPVQFDNNGIYTCSISNSISQDEAQFTVNVLTDEGNIQLW